MSNKTQSPAYGRGYILKPSVNQNVVFDADSAPEEPGDVVVDSTMRRAYGIWKDGSRRSLSAEQTTAIVAEVRRRIQTKLSEPAVIL